MVGCGLLGRCICLLLLHGIEASLLASDSLRRLRLAVRRVVWSRHQPLASVGAVLSPLGVTQLSHGSVCSEDHRDSAVAVH